MSTPFKMKNSPAKLWPWGKTKKSTTIEGGYETKKRTTTRGDVVKTKTSKRLLAGEEGEGGVLDVISKTKTKGGKIVKSKKIIIDEGGHRKTKTVTRKGKTKTVVWDKGKKTVTRT